MANYVSVMIKMLPLFNFTSRLLASSTHHVQPIAIQPQHIKSCNQSPAHHPVGVGLHAQPGLSGHLTLTIASSTHMYNQIAIQPQHIKSCNQSPTHHPIGVGLHAQPGLSGHLTLTSIYNCIHQHTNIL